MQPDTTQPYQYVPLDSLALSPENAATIGRDDVDDLVASIRAIGLQHALVVQEGDGGRYRVKAGGRRLRALRQLKTEGAWDEPVPVKVLPAGANVTEVSLAENVIRRDMHPVDEFEAFRKLADTDGLTVADLAARFGKSQLYVQQRLKLANVAPSILALCRDGDIGLAQVMALAIVDDHAAQERVWKAAQTMTWKQDPDELRAALTTAELSVEDDPVARYLGVKGYEAGGGVARHDLFADDGDAWLPDAELARNLALEKLEKYADKIRKEGWAWVEVRLEFDYSDERKFGVFGKGEYEYIDTSDPKRKWSAEAKAVAGAVVSIDGRGNAKANRAKANRGLLRPEDIKQLAAEAKQAGKKAPATGRKVAPARKPGQLSWAQTQMLQAERDAVLRDELAGNPRIALAALAARLADEVGIIKATAIDGVVKFSKGNLSSDRLPIIARPVVEKSPAAARLREKATAWKAKVPKGSSTLEYLLSQPESVTHELLTLCAAHATVSMPWHDGMQDAGQKLAQIAGVDMASHWSPTAEWLERQPTGYIVEAVTQARGKVVAAELRKAKGKKAVAKKAAELLAAAPGGKPAWLPAPLRAPAVKAKPKKARARGKDAAAGEGATA